MTPPRTSGMKVSLWHKETGQCIERWPVDARELLERGEYTTSLDGSENDLHSSTVLHSPPLAVAQQTDAALISGEMTPIGAPLLVAHTGTMEPANVGATPTAAPKGKK